ncbi:MAG: hypothetical protein Alpg2KO_14860 [Alphaproteobacteria bacterium]
MTDQHTSLTVAQVLRLAREEAGLTVPQLSERLNIAAHHITALEQGRYGDLPGKAYISGFIRSIASHLDLDEDQVMQLYKAETGSTPPGPDMAFRVPHTESRAPSGRVIVTCLILLAVLLGGGWAIKYGQDAISGLFAEHKEDATEQQRIEALLEVPPPPGMPGAEPATDSAAAATETEAEIEAETISAMPRNPEPVPQINILPPQFTTLPDEDSTGEDMAMPDPVSTLAESPSAVLTTETDTPAPEQGDVAAAEDESDSAGDQSTAEATSQQTELQPVASASPVSTPAPIERVDFNRFSRIYGAYNRNSRIAIEATGPAWIRVTNRAGENVFTQTLQSNEIYRAPNQSGLSFRTGNAGAVRLIVDGQRGAVLGEDGEVKRGIPLILPPQ